MLRLLVASSLGAVVGLFAFAVGDGLTGSSAAAAAIAVATAGLAGWAFWRRPWIELDEAACSRGLFVVSGLGTVLAVVELARLTVFVVAPSRIEFSEFPSSNWEIRHSCVSAYYVAARAATDSANVYDGSHYTAPDDNPAEIRKPRTLGPFDVDVYEYPPPFLTLPRWLRMVAPEFLPFRMVWFGLSGMALVMGLVLVARSLGPAVGTRALLLSPLVLSAIPTINFLQKGNAQGLVIAMAVIAMVLFDRGRSWLGGALLAFAVLSKLFPGLLLVWLLARRRWRAVLWTAGFATLFALITLVDLGAASYAAFVEHFPGLVGGEAFPAFRNRAAMAINYSVPGLVFKLKLFGVPGMGFGLSKVVGWAYTAVAAAVTFLVGKRTVRDDDNPLVWLAILTAATLRSPFLPIAYASYPAFWLLTLIAAKAHPNAKTLSLTIAAWLALNIYWALDWPIDPRLLAVVTLLPQAVVIAIAVHVLRRALVEPADTRSSGTALQRA